MLSWGALLGVYAQDGATPLSYACDEGHVEVVKLLLARSDVLVNQAEHVRRRGGLVERGSAGWNAYHDAAAEGGSPHSHEGGVWG